MTGNLFAAVGARPFLGRGLEPADSLPGAEQVVVVSHGFWSQEMGGDAEILGERLRLGGEPVRIVGVMPKGFFFPFPQVRAWRALQIDPASEGYTNNGYLAVLGKVGDSISNEQLEQDVAAIAVTLGDRFDYPEAWDKSKGAYVRPLREFLFGRLRPALLLLLGAVAILMLMACANVAALVVTRTADRRGEMAVRGALGAGRGRLARQLLTESLILALAGGIVGLGLAAALFDLLVARLPLAYGFGETLALDSASLLATLGLVLLATLAVAVFPLQSLASGPEMEALRTRGTARRGAQFLLVFAEAAFAIVLITGAALLIRSVDNLRDVDPGLDPEGVLAVDLVVGEQEMDEDARGSFFAEAVIRAAAIPGVRAAGLTNRLPLRDNGMQAPVRIESRPDLGDRASNSFWRSATPGYFEAAGIQLLRGRLFTEHDQSHSLPVAVISESFAHRIWRDDDPIGQRIKTGNEDFSKWITVVGVVEEVRMRSLSGANTMVLYRPREQRPWTGVRNTLLLRGDVAPLVLAGSVRTAIHALDPRVALARVTPLSRVVSEAMAEPLRLRFFLLLIGGLGLILGAVGIYGVVSYQVTRRRGEIGLRMALGAAPGQLWRQVIARTLGPVAAGMTLGFVASLALARLLRGFLFEVSPNDPASFIATGVVLLLAAVAAAAPAAWRAARFDPGAALRTE